MMVISVTENHASGNNDDDDDDDDDDESIDSYLLELQYDPGNTVSHRYLIISTLDVYLPYHLPLTPRWNYSSL